MHPYRHIFFIETLLLESKIFAVHLDLLSLPLHFVYFLIIPTLLLQCFVCFFQGDYTLSKLGCGLCTITISIIYIMHLDLVQTLGYAKYYISFSSPPASRSFSQPLRSSLLPCNASHASLGCRLLGDSRKPHPRNVTMNNRPPA